MMEQKELFEQPRQNKKVKWFLPTNHLNLMYMLSAGLVMSPKGLGKKYYSDVLAASPGWIPLFADSIPKEAIDVATAEEPHLRPCVAVINLTSLKGQIRILLTNGAIQEDLFPDGLPGTIAAILIPAPLPASWIETILFRSKEDKQAWEQDAQGYKNVPLNGYKREVNPRLLAGSNIKTWHPNIHTIPNRDSSPDTVFAAGGMLGMLFHFADRGEEACKASRLAFDGEESIAETISDPLIRGLYEWLKTGNVPPSDQHLLPGLFWSTINKVAEVRSSLDPKNPIDTVYDFLDTAKNTMNEKLKAALIKLLDDLRSIVGYADSTTSEILERNPKLFSKVMAIFFLMRESGELIEFKYPLEEKEYIASAFLFGARDGWKGLPEEIRDFPGMNAAVSHRMAAMAHRLAGTGLDLGTPPPRCIPLRELFQPGVRGWTVKQKEAALLLARENKWDFVSTKISLSKGKYEIVIDGGGMHILLPGEAKAVETEVDKNQFFNKLPEANISSKLREKIGKILPRSD